MMRLNMKYFLGIILKLKVRNVIWNYLNYYSTFILCFWNFQSKDCIYFFTSLDPTGLKKILEEQNGHISSIGENDSSQIKTKSPNTKNDSISSLTLPSIHNADETAVEAVRDILEDHHTLRITSDEFEGEYITWLRMT